MAAVLGGALNAVAGGGSFITFPSLLFTGVSAIGANATNTVALWTGLVFSGGAFRQHLRTRWIVLTCLLLVSAIGGTLGALLLLRTPAQTFLKILPWLMLAATALFVIGPKLQRRNQVAHAPSTSDLITASFFQLLVAVYGGYFGGGMGIVILALLGAFGMADIHQMNALKTVLSSATNGVAVVIFVVMHAVYWPQALVMIVGAAIGGYFGAHYSLRVCQIVVRRFVIIVGLAITTYFFVRVY